MCHSATLQTMDKDAIPRQHAHNAPTRIVAHNRRKIGPIAPRHVCARTKHVNHLILEVKVEEDTKSKSLSAVDAVSAVASASDIALCKWRGGGAAKGSASPLSQ